VRQDPARATLAPVLSKEHGRLDFSQPAARLSCRIRAFTPWPGAFTELGGRILKVHAARPRADVVGLPPGRVRSQPEGILVGCGTGTGLLITELQLQGKRRLAAAEFLRGQPLPDGTELGS
jgi:methionyl-tRNA formyltransferase